ncbi:hypothetical protein ABZ769_26995 [Streptomyces olivoreticuli]
MTTILHVRFHHVPHEVYGQLFTVLGDISPTVQALPPDSALINITGALRYFQRTPAQLADLLQTRILARYGVQSSIGGAGNRMLATLAGSTCLPGEVRILPEGEETLAAFLAEQPVQALPGVGPALARTLARYGLTTAGDLRDLPSATLQRIAGKAAGRLLHERAHGIDPRPVTPAGPPASLSAKRTFHRDTLDPDTVHKALLSLAVELGNRLRASHMAARSIELQVRYADRSTTTRSRTLREASHHTPALQEALCSVFASLGLQRARIRALSARADLTPAAKTAIQLTFDRTTEDARRLEPTIDKANARFGAGTLRPASLAKPSSARLSGSRGPRASLSGAGARCPCQRAGAGAAVCARTARPVGAPDMLLGCVGGWKPCAADTSPPAARRTSPGCSR